MDIFIQGVPGFEQDWLPVLPENPSEIFRYVGSVGDGGVSPFVVASSLSDLLLNEDDEMCKLLLGVQNKVWCCLQTTVDDDILEKYTELQGCREQCSIVHLQTKVVITLF